MSEIIIKTPEEINDIREGGYLLFDILQKLKSAIKNEDFQTGLELDAYAEKLITGVGAVPAFKGYQGFPGSVCFSVNDEVVHGIPTERKIETGDLVKIDCGLFYKNLYTDSAITVVAGGNATKEDAQLMEVTKASLFAGIDQAIIGNKVGDISSAVEEYIKPHGYGIVTKLAGHGVGKEIHEAPEILNFGKKGTGPLLTEGMVIAIEPMVNAGGHDVYFADDGWAVVTSDHSRAAHFEHTVAITKNGPEILTLRP